MNKARFYRISSLLIPLYFPFSALWAAQTVSFAVKPPAEKIILATPFALEMDAAYADNFRIHPDTSSLQTESFAILRVTRGEPKKSGGIIAQKFTFEVMPFEIGLATFPALNWELIPDRSASQPADAGLSAQTVLSPSMMIEISGITPESAGEKDINDIRPPVWPFPLSALILGILILLITGTGVVMHMIHKRKLRRILSPDADNRTPDIIALDELNSLLSSDLWEKGELKKFYDRLAEITRLYIFRSFGIPAQLMTTADLNRMLRDAGLKLDITGSVRSILESCDLAKFAKHMPSISERDKDCGLVRKIIELTQRTAKEAKEAREATEERKAKEEQKTA